MTPFQICLLRFYCLLTLFIGLHFTGGAQPIPASKDIPILCYHQIRNYTANDGPEARAYTVTPENFLAQMKILSDSGYHSILPDALYNWYTFGKALPPKSVMICFDDNTQSQFGYALPVLNKYGFKAVFFVMTVSLNKPNYLSVLQLKTLQQQGHVIAAHSWNHKNVRQYVDADWKIQLDDSFKTLQSITETAPKYFAYPFGAWSQQSIVELKKRGIKMAFILNTKQDAANPMFTIRRQIVVGSLSASMLLRNIKSNFEVYQKK